MSCCQTSSFMIRYLCTALSSYQFHRRESREGLPLIFPDQPLTDLTLQSFLINELERGRTPDDENISWIYFKGEHVRKDNQAITNITFRMFYDLYTCAVRKCRYSYQ